MQISPSTTKALTQPAHEPPHGPFLACLPLLASWLFLELCILQSAPGPLHLTSPRPGILVDFFTFRSQLKIQFCQEAFTGLPTFSTPFFCLVPS